MKILRLKLAATLAAALSILLAAVPVAATTITNTTGGCTGDGTTTIVSNSYSFTQTNAGPYGGCGYVYSQGTFVYGGSAHIRGPGWGTGPIQYEDVFQNVVSASGIHNLCNAGGPCTGSQQWSTAA